MRKNLKKIGLLVFLLILLNGLSANVFYRFDFTKDKRYSIANVSRNIIDKVDRPLQVEVYLTGKLPPAFQKLKEETRFLLEEFSAYNSSIKVNFINPVSGDKEASEVATKFFQEGMIPERLNIRKNNQVTEKIIFPWAKVKYRNKSKNVRLFIKKLNASNQEMVDRSIENLEYALADAIKQVSTKREKKIAVMRGKGELADRYIADYLTAIRDYYYIAPFSLKKANEEPQKTLEQLQDFDLILEAKPTEKFTEKEKYVLDQYIMNGGKSLWMTESVAIEKDSLISEQKAIALNNNLNLTDLFFAYGIRINPEIVKTLYSSPILLAQGKGKNTSFNPFPWFYEPLTKAAEPHPINQNLNDIRMIFANPIDTLANAIKKTVLLESSPRSKTLSVPYQVSLNEIRKEPDVKTYNEGSQPLAVLLEGKFKSMYQNRIKPFEVNENKDTSKPTQQIIISDGDIVKNELRKGEPLSLGFDKYSGKNYGNKDFLLNSVNYLLGDQKLVDLRTKSIQSAVFDQERLAEAGNFWKGFNLMVGVVIIGAFGFIYGYLRRRKFVR
jgi:gliding-associated putative ABC transporter substrate-binding component GldG